jgi:hypothetical protein
MVLLATIGAKALYLLFVWLISASAAAWLSARKGYGERLGLTFGLVLTALGLLIVLLLPGRPGSAWKDEGWLPRRRRKTVHEGQPLGASSVQAAAESADGEDPPVG